MSAALDPWYLEHLVCPRDQLSLRRGEDALECDRGHRYPIVEGVPIMLLADASETIGIASASLAAATVDNPSGLYLDTLSLSAGERAGIAALASTGSAIDPVVAYLVAATNGLTYRHLIGTLDRYPIPTLPLPPGQGRRLLDIGCSWGRWTLAASAAGYDAIGIDPSLGAVLAARRVANALQLPARFIVGDARHLPLPPACVDTVYSYSVLQHLSYADVETVANEIGRVLAAGGLTKVQMPTRFGVRCLYHQARRGFREPRGFEVRYWTRSRLRRLFERAVGAVSFDVDCYFGIGLQPADRPLMTRPLAAVLTASELLKRISATVVPLQLLADSVYVSARRQGSALS